MTTATVTPPVQRVTRDGVLLAGRKLAIITLQTVLIALSYVLTFELRFDYAPDQSMHAVMMHSLVIVILVKLSIFQLFGLLRGWWQYVGLNDLFDIAKATTASAVVLYSLLLFIFSTDGYPRSVVAIDWFLTVIFVGGARFAVRAYTEAIHRHSGRRNTLIVGAGPEGANIVRELKQADNVDHHPVAIVDDDPSKLGLRLHGVQVVGTTNDIDDIVRQYRVKSVLIAGPTSSRGVQRVVDQCRSCRVDFKILPTLDSRLNGKSTVLSHVRQVDVEDLLGRLPVRLDLHSIRDRLQSKVILITGAGGSIGSELTRQIATFGPSRLVLFDQSENDQFKLSMELSKSFPDIDHVSVIGDILDVGLLRDVFAFHRPDSVFHAAAYKHVPMMEQNYFQAVANNVFGTYNVALIAGQFGAKDFVFISTDKAVNPTSVMGVTKRIAELVVLGLQDHQTRFVCVRFGNVLGSNGSVIPIFEQQIAQGGPVTVKHPDVTRYFMTIPEAVQLVLQASTMGSGGEIFVLDMGEPVRISQLANDLIRLSGLEPGKDINIVFTGLRPGEKLFEELCFSAEGTKPTAHEKIRVLDGGQIDVHHLHGMLDELSAAVIAKNTDALIQQIKCLVPQYTPSKEVLSLCAIDHHDFALAFGVAHRTLAASHARAHTA